VTASIWSERWEPLDRRLRALEARLRAARACVLRGEAHDDWDLEVRSGILGVSRLIMGVEDHAGAKQLVRLRWWPKIPMRVPILALGFAALAGAAAQAPPWGAAGLLGLGVVLPTLHSVEQCMAGMAAIKQTVEQLKQGGW